MSFSTIEVTNRDARGAIRLNRPSKLNPLGTATLLELIDAARFFDSRPEIKVVVVSGAGRAFSAGADLASFSTEAQAAPSAGSARDAADAGRRMADAVESMRAVTVARLHGHCVGGGVVLAARATCASQPTMSASRYPKWTWGSRSHGVASPVSCGRWVPP